MDGITRPFGSFCDSRKKTPEKGCVAQPSSDAKRLGPGREHRISYQPKCVARSERPVPKAALRHSRSRTWGIAEQRFAIARHYLGVSGAGQISLPAEGLQPFIEGGPSFRTAGNLNGTDPSHYGGTAGVGVDLHVGILNVSPVLRYTRWSGDLVRSAQANTNPDQLELLVEVSHGSETKGHPWGNHFALGVIGGETLRGDLPSASGPIIVGVPTGGSSLQTATATYSGLHDPTIGPMVEFALPKEFSLEVDALYHPLRYHSETTLNGAVTGSTTFNDAITWDFPVFEKYKFPLGPVRPFLEVGPSFRLPQNMNGLSTAGVATGAGIESAA